VDNVHFELLIQDAPPEFDFDFQPDDHLRVKAEDGSGPNSDNVGALVIQLCDDPDEDGVCEVGEDGPTGLPGTGILLGEVLRDARARADDIPSFLGTWGDSSANAIDGRLDIDGDGDVDADDDGKFASLRIFDGRVDINGDGAITGADDGRLAGKLVTNGDSHDHNGGDGATLVAGSLGADIVDDTKVGNRVPQFYRRQGGSPSNWATPGTSTQTPGAVRMQAGIVSITIPNGSSTSNILTVTFPQAFGDIPLVFVSLVNNNGYLGDQLYTRDATATTVGIVANRESIDTAGDDVLSAAWLAIGPE